MANIVKSTGTLEYSYSYQPYGTFRSNVKNDTAIATDFNPMSFDSEFRDKATTGFINLRARMYDPGTGAFVQSDPVSAHPFYEFAAGNPAMYSDPSGMCILLCVLVLAAVIGATIGVAGYAAYVGTTGAGWNWWLAIGWATLGGFIGATCVLASTQCYIAVSRVGTTVGLRGLGGGGAASVLKGPIADAVPRNLPEQLAMNAAREGQGTIIMRYLVDAPRLVANYGEGNWVKMQYVLRGWNDIVTVHYFRNLVTKMDVEFKFV